MNDTKFAHRFLYGCIKISLNSVYHRQYLKCNLNAFRCCGFFFYLDERGKLTLPDFPRFVDFVCVIRVGRCFSFASVFFLPRNVMVVNHLERFQWRFRRHKGIELCLLSPMLKKTLFVGQLFPVNCLVSIDSTQFQLNF